MNKIITNTLLYTLGGIFPQAVGFILLPLYTKYLSPEQYGIISSMLVIQVLLVIIFSITLERSVVRLYWDYKSDEEKKTFIGTLSKVIFINSIIVLALVFLFRDSFQKIFPSIAFSPFYVYTVLTVFFKSFSLVPKNYLRLKNRALNYFVVSLLELILSTGFVLWYVIYLNEGAEGLLKGKMIAFLIMIPVYVYIVRTFLSTKIDFKILKCSLKFCLPIIPTLIASWIITQVDRIFIERYFSLSEVGIYSLSRRVAGMLALVSASFMKAYHPMYFELANSDDLISAKAKLYKYNNVFIMTLIIFWFLLSFFSKELVFFFMDQRYQDAALFIPLLAFGVLITSISSTVIGASFMQSKKMKQDMYIGLSGAVLTILLNYALIESLSLYGASIAYISTALFIFVTSYIYMKKNCFYIPFDWKKKIGILLLFMVILVVFYVINISIYVLAFSKVLILLVLITYIYFFHKDKFLILFKKR